MLDRNSQRRALSHLSRSLQHVHRVLLHFQTEVRESLDERRLSPNDVLHLSLNDPDFSWLRKISALIVQMDEGVDDAEADLSVLATVIDQELRALFVDPSLESDFKQRLEMALQRNPSFHLELAELRRLISPNVPGAPNEPNAPGALNEPNAPNEKINK